jgi:biopolymer transport protein ExbD
MIFPRKPRRSPTLNIIPLIDVLVVLLIFYIATTVFKKSEPKIIIKVPSSTTATTTKETPPSIIYVTADSKIFLDDTPLDPAQLGDTLKSKIASDPNFKVAMKSDEKTPFGMVVKVLDAAHTAGITDLQTFTQQEKGAGGTPSP